MVLKSQKSIWGVSVVNAEKTYKKYLVRFMLLGVALAVTVFLLGFVYAVKNPSGNPVVLILGALCMVIIYDNVHRLILDDNEWATIKFYHKHRNAEVHSMYINVTEKNMFSIAFITNPRLNLDDGQSMEYYKGFIEVCCYRSLGYARHVLKYMSAYKSEDGLGVYYITEGSKKYFIGFMDEGTKEPVEDNQDAEDN